MLSPSNDSNTLRYKAAISLNNSAVTLLIRRRYKDSVNAFRVSISLMQNIIDDIKNPNDSPNVSTPIIEDDDINRHLYVACCCCASNDTTVGQSYAKLTVVKFYSEQDASTVIDSICQASRDGTDTVYTCVIIEPLDHDDFSLELIGLDSDSIIYNFGIAHCLLASQLSAGLQYNPRVIDEVRQTAFQLFRLIEPYFLMRLSWYPTKFDNRGVMLLCTFFVQAMSQVARQLQYTAISESYDAALQTILLSMCHQEMLIPTRGRPASAA